jgi:4-alpha-glucanotransferase
MKVTFKINYRTCYGQQLLIEGIPGQQQALMTPKNNGDWFLTVDLDKLPEKEFTYKYLMKDSNVFQTLYEFGTRRFYPPEVETGEILVHDFWKPLVSPTNVSYSSAFKDVVFKRENPETFQPLMSRETPEPVDYGYDDAQRPPEKVCVRASIALARVKKEHYVAVKFLGSLPENDIIIKLYDDRFPKWRAEFMIDKPKGYYEYKYCLCDKKTSRVVLEEYVTRYFSPVDSYDFYILNDEDFKFPRYPWKGAGVSVPVFSLRSDSGCGVGEFADLIPLVDWAKSTGIKMIQLLPINDTVATHTYKDSYPYRCVSVFALHPLYLRIEDMGKHLSETSRNILESKKHELNALEKIDYEEVMRLKSRYFKMIYDENKRAFLQEKEYQEFYQKNSEWLNPYAVFSYLRDLYATADFSRWGDYAVYDKQKVDTLCQEDNPDFDDVAIHFFIQYHLHLQLSKVSEYARENGIVLKGDIPIGIGRFSVDAWVNPRLYNLDCQAGAPPDDFSDDGQNWGFPTYNWNEMEKDGFAWWKARLRKMQEYFDAYRIDHILGFFRIWSIPTSQTKGLMGVFDTAIPISRQEFEQRGLNFDEKRFCTPYIRQHIVEQIFGEQAGYVKHSFLDVSEDDPDVFTLKSEYDTQAKIEESFKKMGCSSPEEMLRMQMIKQGLLYLVSEVLFFKDKEKPDSYHPRHSLFKTNSYNELEQHAKYIVDDLYNDYFYRRNENLWKAQAELRLPALIGATNMLVCGEDLGMIPACVPEVMRKLNILSLEIQRMPKEPLADFGQPASYPFLSVATPSTHDTSSVRSWWEENHDRSQRFYNNILSKSGQAPFYCETWVVKDILYQHLYSPAMWAVFQIQDILGLDENLRSRNPKDDRINVPSEQNHYWRYRCHISLDKLQHADGLNNTLREMLHYSGRDIAY